MWFGWDPSKDDPGKLHGSPTQVESSPWVSGRLLSTRAFTLLFCGCPTLRHQGKGPFKPVFKRPVLDFEAGVGGRAENLAPPKDKGTMHA